MRSARRRAHLASVSDNLVLAAYTTVVMIELLTALLTGLGAALSGLLKGLTP